MERYEKYKNSGIEWIGEIPEEWEINRLKHITGQSLQNGIFKKSKDFGTGIKLVNVGNIYTDNFLVDESSLERVVCSEAEIETYTVNNGDVFFVRSSLKRDGIAKVACFVGKTEPTVFECHLIKISPKHINYQYLNYYLNSNLLRSRLVSLSITTTMTTISQDSIGSIDVTVPPADEQTAIANYLDRKTAEIDELIDQKERLIELYEEEKTAIINQAVTKGIDPDVSLKDSGIDWLGEIPKGWEVSPLKMATKIIRGKFGHRPRNDPSFYNGEYPFIQTGDVAKAGKYVEKFHQTLNEKGLSVSQEFPIDTLVMTIAANIGDLAILSFKACFPDSIVGFYPLHENSSEFLYYLFTSMKTEFLRVSTNNTQMNINIDRISTLKIPIPAVHDQTAIVHHIETETARIDAKIAKTKKIIILQKEYRTALISEVVTGKIKVTVETTP